MLCVCAFVRACARARERACVWHRVCGCVLPDRLPPGDVSVPRIKFLECFVYLVYDTDSKGTWFSREVLAEKRLDPALEVAPPARRAQLLSVTISYDQLPSRCLRRRGSILRSR